MDATGVILAGTGSNGSLNFLAISAWIAHIEVATVVALHRPVINDAFVPLRIERPLKGIVMDGASHKIEVGVIFRCWLSRHTDGGLMEHQLPGIH